MPAMTIPDTGLGATISGTGLVTTHVVSIGEMSLSIDALDITTLTNTSLKRMRPSDLRNPPEVEIEFMWMGASPPMEVPMTGTTGTTEPYAGVSCTITFPQAGSVAGSVFVKSVTFPRCAQGEIMKGKYVLQFDGASSSAFAFTAA